MSLYSGTKDRNTEHYKLKKKNIRTILKSVRILPRDLVIAIGLSLYFPNEFYKFSRTVVLDTRITACAFKRDTASYVVLIPN